MATAPVKSGSVSGQNDPTEDVTLTPDQLAFIRRSVTHTSTDNLKLELQSYTTISDTELNSLSVDDLRNKVYDFRVLAGLLKPPKLKPPTVAPPVVTPVVKPVEGSLEKVMSIMTNFMQS